MTFEEFFIKKRIDLVALQKAEPSLFSEFKAHFEQMGEKSFDHTKKYWFNKLRHQYHLAPEIKIEKPALPNPLAEQTIAESLGETAEANPLPKSGFVPRFKASNMPKPAANQDKIEEKPTALPEPASDNPPETPSAKPAYKPRFNMKNIPPKAEE